MPRRTNREIGESWERDVKNFFNSLGFENVDGGSHFIPGNKGDIDVVAGINNVLFIGECKTKHEIGRNTNLVNEVKKFRLKSLAAIKALKEGYHGGKYKKYTHFKLFIATKDIIWDNSEKAMLVDPLKGEPLKAYAFDETFFDYYDTLKNELSEEISRFHLLADTHADFIPREPLEVNAINTDIKGFKIYTFVVTPQKILPYVAVARREAARGQSNSEYYQRMIKGNRCQDIINYIDSNDGLFPNGHIIPGSIILATNPGIELGFTGDSEYGKLTIPQKHGIFWVVDGQHRLFSYSKNSLGNIQRRIRAEDKVVVTLLHNLTRSQQRKIFVDINDTQKGVDTAYLLDIEGEANPLSDMGVISNTIKKIDKISKNFFFRKIKIPSHGIKGRKFSMGSFYEAIKRAKLIERTTKNSVNEHNNPFHSRTNRAIISNKLANSLTEYFTIAIDILGSKLDREQNRTAYKTLNEMLEVQGKEGVVDILIMLYERILTAHNKKTKRTTIPTEEYIRTCLKSIATALDNVKTTQDYANLINTVGHGNRDNTVRRLCSIIRDSGLKEFEFDDLDLDINEIVQQTKILETKLKELINEVMSREISTEWCKGPTTDILGKSIFDRLKVIKAGDIERNPEFIEQGKLYKGLTIGLSKDLILKFWELYFADVFVVGGNKFRDKNQFSDALIHLGLYRNSEFHNEISEDERKIIKMHDQKKQAESLLRIFNKVLDSIATLPESEESESN